MRLCVLLRSARSIAIGNNTLTIRTFFFPRHDDHFLPQAHRETEAHFTATGMPSQRNIIFQLLKSEVGLTASKAAALRININIDRYGVAHPQCTLPLALPFFSP